MRRKTVEDIFYDGIHEKNELITSLEGKEQTPEVKEQIKLLNDAIEMLTYDLAEREFRQQMKHKYNNNI